MTHLVDTISILDYLKAKIQYNDVSDGFANNILGVFGAYVFCVYLSALLPSFIPLKQAHKLYRNLTFNDTLIIII